MPILIFQSCSSSNSNQHGHFKKNNCYLLKINSQPILPENQIIGTTYIHDYQITDTVPLNKASRNKFIKATKDKDNFSPSELKCPFLPTYAFVTSQQITLISIKPCAKIQTINRATGESEYLDVQEKNTFLKLLEYP